MAERITGAQITYSLANDKGWFEINSTTGVITVARTLDREVQGYTIITIIIKVFNSNKF